MTVQKYQRVIRPRYRVPAVVKRVRLLCSLSADSGRMEQFVQPSTWTFPLLSYNTLASPAEPHARVVPEPFLSYPTLHLLPPLNHMLTLHVDFLGGNHCKSGTMCCCIVVATAESSLKGVISSTAAIVVCSKEGRPVTQYKPCIESFRASNLAPRVALKRAALHHASITTSTPRELT